MTEPVGIDDLFMAVMRAKNLIWELSEEPDYIDATVFGDTTKTFLVSRKYILIVDGKRESAIFRGKTEREVTTNALRAYLK